MRTALMFGIRAALSRRGGDSGFAIVLVALLLVFLMVTAAIVVDLANARQQNRDAVAAADAGALAGAQALTGTATMPALCTSAGTADVNCLAAWHTFESENIVPTSMTRTGSCTLETTAPGDTCYHYTAAGNTVEVKYPYALTGYTNTSLVRVRTCWNANTSFARIIGTNTVNVCGAATAQWTGNNGSGTGGGVVPDCSVEDNFEDTSTNPSTYTVYTFNPGDFPAVGGTWNAAKGNALTKNNQDIAVVFNGHGTEVDLTSIVWMAPTTVSGPSGTNVQLPRINPPNSNNGPESSNAHGIGYVVQTLDTTGKLRAYDPATYPASAGNKTVISYQLPDDSHLKVNGQNFVYNSTLHVNDSDNTTNPPSRCGNASWTFTHDGNNVTNGGCTESSFWGFPQSPASGAQITAGVTTIQGFYVDESPLENIDQANWPGTSGFPATPNFGIDFKYTVGGTTTSIPQYDSTIHPVGFVPSPNPNNAYWLTQSDSGHSSDKYNTTINWKVPSNLANGSYAIYLKGYDTDHPGGGDCGVATWTYTVTGGNHGTVSLVE